MSTGNDETDKPVIEHIEKPVTLCGICQTLGLSVGKFFIPLQDNAQDGKAGSRQLGLLVDIRKKTFCPFCRLVVRAAARSLHQIPQDTIIDEQGPTCHMRWLIDGQQQHGVGDDQEQTYHARTRRIHIYSEPMAFRDAYLVLLADDAPSPLFFGRIMPRYETNYSLLLQWSSLCERCHGSVCNEPLAPKITEIGGWSALRLVDVERQCIVSAPSISRYIALSYLWGRNARAHFRATTGNIDFLGVPGSLAKIELSKTILDAIILVASLGERYLWVDSLCLVFDGARGESFEDYHVDTIYANAFLTVIAGTGSDHDAGLPGVQPTSRIIQQEVEKCGLNLRLMLTYLAEDYIRTSEWDTRGWTFQERLLSRRCLLFVNGRIYFQCRQTTFCEDIVGEQEEVGWSLDSTGMPSRIFRGPPSLQYISAVQLYTQRKLTLESDILRAFEGVANVLQRHMETNFLYGLPESMVDYALLWESAQQLRRRPDFPSWSWAGWVGEVQWNVSLPRTWIAWYKQHANGNTIFMPQGSLTTNGDLARTTMPSSIKITSPSSIPIELPILRFWTDTAYFRINSPITSTVAESSHLQRSLSFPSPIPTTQCPSPTKSNTRLCLQGADGKWCGSVLLNSSLTEPTHNVHEFIILSSDPSFTAEKEARRNLAKDDEPHAVYNVLLVEWKDSIAYRVGLGRVYCDALNRSFEPGVIRKEILLG